jgi:hypothetical protein
MKSGKGQLQFAAGFLLGSLIFGGTAALAANGATAILSSQKIHVDGKETPMAAYSIDGGNYVRLRDIGMALNFSVTFDSAANSVRIESGAPYPEDAAADAPPHGASGLIHKGIKIVATPEMLQLFDGNGKTPESLRTSDKQAQDLIEDCVGRFSVMESFEPGRFTAYLGQKPAASAGKVLTCGSVGMSQPTNMWIAYEIEPSGALAQPPAVGSFPAKILLPGKTDIAKAESYYPSYFDYDSGGCNWYAFGRLAETSGIAMPIPYKGRSGFLDEVEALGDPGIRVIRDIGGIVSGCVAFFHHPSEHGAGHFVFVEHVERDASGNPSEICYTEANRGGSGQYRPQVDGKACVISFSSFASMCSSGKRLLGYIAPA